MSASTSDTAAGQRRVIQIGPFHPLLESPPPARGQPVAFDLRQYGLDEPPAYGEFAFTKDPGRTKDERLLRGVQLAVQASVLDVAIVVGHHLLPEGVDSNQLLFQLR